MIIHNQSKLQAIVKGYLCRKRLRKLKDSISLDRMEKMLENFKGYHKNILILNQDLHSKKNRHPNFPSEISENIVKFAFFKKYKIMPSWDTDRGDLVLFNGKSIEVKAFSSIGPTSFGPKEEWNLIYFVDATRFMDSQFIVYECHQANTDQIWRQLKMNKKETYEEQCRQGRRPRIQFGDIQKQLGNRLNIIYQGNLENLRT